MIFKKESVELRKLRIRILDEEGKWYKFNAWVKDEPDYGNKYAEKLRKVK